jgi:diguanylate cyclase (GGDEF)-like protein
VGDDVLRESARRLTAVCRAYDSVGRYGGEEFLIILPGCHANCVGAHAERLRQAISLEPMRIGDLELQISASFGATYAVPAFASPPEGLLRAADTALYCAKREGRNCIRVIEFEREQFSGSSGQQLVGQLASNR